MIHAKGRYRNQTLVLDRPLALPEDAEVDVEIHPAGPGAGADAEQEGWSDVGMERLEEEWSNPEDAVYDDWKKLYGV